ncbi:MAG: MurR/RpiR family transcriptional regulator [Lysinibacillus sp.]
MSICDSIKKKYIRLSKGQRKMAQFVIDNPNVIATQVASEVGRQAGVSESTVIRFCYAMDLAGFGELQQKIKEYLIEKNGSAPVALKTHAYKKQNIPCNEVMSKDVDGIISLMQNINGADFNRTVDMLHHAERIFILGVRSSAPVALMLYDNLVSCREEVYLMNYRSEKWEVNLTQMNGNSVLFVAGLNEQQEDVMAVVELAKRKGVKIIAITDGVPSPLQEQSDVLFAIKKVQREAATCDIAVFSLLNAIVECMVMQNKKYYKAARKENMQNITDSLLELV